MQLLFSYDEKKFGLRGQATAQLTRRPSSNWAKLWWRDAPAKPERSYWWTGIISRSKRRSRCAGNESKKRYKHSFWRRYSPPIEGKGLPFVSTRETSGQTRHHNPLFVKHMANLIINRFDLGRTGCVHLDINRAVQNVTDRPQEVRQERTQCVRIHFNNHNLHGNMCIWKSCVTATISSVILIMIMIVQCRTAMALNIFISCARRQSSAKLFPRSLWRCHLFRSSVFVFSFSQHGPHQ